MSYGAHGNRDHMIQSHHPAQLSKRDACLSNPETTSAANWDGNRRERRGGYVGLLLPAMAAYGQEVTCMKCSCKKGCSRICTCFRAGLPCTSVFAVVIH